MARQFLVLTSDAVLAVDQIASAEKTVREIYVPAKFHWDWRKFRFVEVAQEQRAKIFGIRYETVSGRGISVLADHEAARDADYDRVMSALNLVGQIK